MPTIQKQHPTRVVPKPSSNGSVLARAVPVSDLKDDFLKFLIYGRNRTGKTTLACQFEKPLLIVSFEPGKRGGAKSVKKVAGVEFVRIEATEDAILLARELKTDRTFKSHLLDSASSLQDVALKELMGLDEAPVQLNWGLVPENVYRERSEKAKEIMRLFIDLPANTIITALEKDHKKPSERTSKLMRGFEPESFFAADLGGATVDWLHNACDYIGQLYMAREVVTRKSKHKIAGKEVEHSEEVETGKIVRRLRTMYHPNFAAGFRSENPSSVPEFIEAKSPEEMYAKIVKVIRGEKLSVM